MSEKKIVKVVTLTIKAKRLLEEQEGKEGKAGVLLFKNSKRGRGRSPILFPKKVMYNFSKVIVYFPTWRGREKFKAFKFDIPLWLYNKKKENDIIFLGDDVIVKNTHK